MAVGLDFQFRYSIFRLFLGSIGAAMLVHAVILQPQVIRLTIASLATSTNKLLMKLAIVLHSHVNHTQLLQVLFYFYDYLSCDIPPIM